MKESVLKDLQDAGVSNYMIFPLYSQWDVLIRAWADEKTAAKLKIKLIENKDLHKDRQPEFLVVHKHTHFPETNTLPDEPRELERILDLTSLKDVQDRGDVSQDFKRLKDAGLILDDIVSFDPDRIQFYITIRSIDGLNNTSLKRLKELVANSIKVRNRSIYTTGGSSIGAVIKAQTDNYYVINDFLQAIARELESDGVITETMLVANRAVRMGKRIDFSRAEEHVIEHELQKLIPEIGAGSKLSYKDCVSLVAKYVGVRKRLHEDKDGVLVKLIRAKARDSAEEVGSIIFSFFPAFEDKLRRKLVPLAQRL
jgi:competence protein ComGC